MENVERSASDEQLLHRIRSEYLEMPGLRLLPQQAQRLWALDADTCARLLARLVEVRFLECGVDGRYGQVTEHRMHRHPMRMVKAEIDVDGSSGQAVRLRHM